jgi:DNA-binding transcriptional MerR regulator
MKELTLVDVARRTGIKINSLRYHIKKMPQYFNLPRDRYNRFLFDENSIELLKFIHESKQTGKSYPQICKSLNSNSSHSVSNGASLEPEPQNPSEISKAESTKIQSLEAKVRQILSHMEDIVKKNSYLHETNKILYEEKLKVEQHLKQVDEHLESLEQRVALLVDLQTKAILGNEEDS